MQVKHDLAKFECIKYEVANSYEFYELPFVWICTMTKPTRHRGLDKSY